MTLFEEISIRIECYGGREKLARDIDKEWGFFLGGKQQTYAQRKRGATPVWSETDNEYLLKYYKKYSLHKLSTRLGRSENAILLRLGKITKATQ